MITAPHLSALLAGRVAATGHCPVCAAGGRTVLAAPGRDRCTVHLGRPAVLVETIRTGQTRLVAPAVARRRPVYPTGLQTPCVACAAAGVDRQGLPRDGDGSDPWCMSCWRGRTDRAQRRAVAELRAAALDVANDVDQGCAACGEPEPSPTCWLCGYSWLADARRAAELDQAAVEQRFAAVAEPTVAEARVAELAAWVERLRTTVESYAVRGRRGRAVELLADLLARDAAGRTGRRGRPSMLARVAAVVAVDADFRTGQRALPGRERCAELAGCTPRAVTSAWARAETLEWAVRTRQGRRLTLTERIQLGRCNDRAEFDLAPLHRGDPAVRAPYVPVALLVLDELLQHALALLETAQDDLDRLTARTDGLVDAADMARRTQLRLAVAAARETVLADVESIATSQIETGNFFPPRSATRSEYVSTCLSRGFGHSPLIAPSRDWNRQSREEIGASRSPGRADGSRSRRVERPRSPQRPGGGSQPGRPRPQWSGWAYELARALQTRWTWLASSSLPRIAATLGPRLGPDWTADELVRHIGRARHRPVLETPNRPLAYLRTVLDESLAGGIAPPVEAAAHTAHRREQVARQGAELRERQALRRAEWAARERTVTGLATVVDQDQEQARAVVRPAQRSAAAEAAIAAIRARTSGRLRRTDRTALLDTVIAAGEGEWPEVAQPGAGLPPGLGA